MGDILSTGSAIDGVLVEPRRQIFDDRGAVMHIMRADWPQFAQFGEAYVSLVKEGSIKAWKRHRIMSQHLAVPAGEIKIVICDDRPGSPTCGAVQQIVTGARHYGLVRIPPMVWYGFKGLAAGDSLIFNCASHLHDPAEVDRIDPAQFPFRIDW
jgi:dTDP-4-dehydrorhamnose 3,5-epimerase